MTTDDTHPDQSRPARRRADVADYILRHGSAPAAELADIFDVSVMTVHRDLDELERQGIVRKYRGGASAQPTSVFESNVAYRLRTAQPHKHALATYARTLVEPGMSLMLDDSTTTLALVPLLTDATPLTVATNFLHAIKPLSTTPDLRLIALGGEYHPNHDSFLGVPCIDAIDALHTDLLIASTSAISHTHAYHQEQEIVLVKRAMMRSATRRVLLLDHGKLHRTALHRLAPLTDFDLVVVDQDTPEADQRALRDNGATLAVAPA